MSGAETESRNTGAGGATGSESGPTTGAGGATGNEEAGLDAPAAGGENPVRGGGEDEVAAPDSTG
ncbi:MAG TPA: hypothetical protein VF586_20195 [Pyrinomonadaceae bacterium]